MFIPDDENGDVLRRMVAKGDDLTQLRDIDFTVVFADEISANEFASHFKSLGLATSVERTGVEKELPWDVKVVRNMAPQHDKIGEFEDELELVAMPLGGRNDGWGCFTIPNNLPS
jgi:Regulator of ribonuclease activity B